ncbi:MAG: tRNA pseudouridine(55) synthase TruB [Deltaproteobacteria bacterium]|nr:tRNA pseudouridine(55) synthase TruB [Deltaproteobacteria bacterium]MBN2687117.1 tRNA pseudouridine(55) synthase TruB [Deltaproteobacteria bacterium]
MNGIIVVDKSSGKTSYDVVRRIKKILKPKKIGHTGTLDPLATGVLAVCLNEATKLARFFIDDDKEYRVVMLLGVKTDTLDTDGQIISEQEPRCDKGDVEEVIMSCIGRHNQAPPLYSAVKFKGKPLYKWTRQGVNIELPPRDVEIYTVNIEDISMPYATFHLSCSKGTYIRALCADVGDRLGCGACVAGLRRTRSGRFLEHDAVSLNGCDEKEQRERLLEHFISLDDAMPDLPSIPVDHATEKTLRQGCQPIVEVFENSDISSLNEGDLIKFKSRDNNLVAIARMNAGAEIIPLLDKRTPVARLVRVFNG